MSQLPRVFSFESSLTLAWFIDRSFERFTYQVCSTRSEATEGRHWGVDFTGDARDGCEYHRRPFPCFHCLLVLLNNPFPFISISYTCSLISFLLSLLVFSFYVVRVRRSQNGIFVFLCNDLAPRNKHATSIEQHLCCISTIGAQLLCQHHPRS